MAYAAAEVVCVWIFHNQALSVTINLFFFLSFFLGGGHVPVKGLTYRQKM